MKGATHSVAFRDKFFRALYEESPCGIAISAGADCTPELVNNAACKMLGYSESEFLGLRMDVITHPDDRHAEFSLVERLRASEVSAGKLEKRCLTKKGEYLWVRVNISLIKDHERDDDLLLFIFQDILEQREIRRIVEEKEKRDKAENELENKALKEIIDALDESSLVSIADTRGTILKVNKRFCEVAKYTEEELLGKSHSIINSGYHSKEFWSDFWKTISKAEVWRGEIKNRAKDGTEYWVNTTINPIRNENGEIIHYLSIRQDISDRKNYEQLLLQSNIRLAQIEQFIDFTTDAIQVSDLDGQFVYINHMASQRLGIAREDCHKFNVTDIEVLLKNKSDWQKHVAQLKEAGSIHTEGININQSTGRSFPVEETVRHISIHGKDYVIVVSRDITERQKNEMVLRESQARLAEAQRLAKLGYWEYDLVLNKVWWSEEQYKINGITRTDQAVTQQDFESLLHPDDRQWFSETMTKPVPASGERSGIYRIIRPDGEVRLILGSSRFTYNEQGQPVKLSGVNQDVTDRMLTEKALRESEETLRKAQAVAKVGSWKLDVKNDLLEWSDEAYKIFNVPQGKTLTYNEFLSHVHPEDIEFVDKSWAAALNGTPYDIMHRIIVDQKIKWVREQAEFTFDDFRDLNYCFGTVQDVTDHKDIQDSNFIFNQSLLLTGIGSWRASFKNNDLFCSDNVYYLHGLCKENTIVTYEAFLNLVYAEDRRRIQFVIAKALLNRGSFETEYRVEISRSKIQWLSAKGKVLSDQEGNPIEIYGIVRDITLERTNTAELIKARKEAEEASYIKDEFLSVMSHEIRTPLNSVIGLSNLILKRNPRTDQLEIMKTLKGSADNLMHLVNDILDFNKIRAGKLELEFIPFRLTQFLQQIHASFKLSAQDKDIEFSIHADARIPDVLIGDVTRLNQVFNNLLGNAIKFTHFGYVKFKVDLLSMTEKSCSLIFNVEDTGVGIMADKVETIFHPFQQSERDTARKYGGTGLGLSIVKSLIEILDGQIRVSSVPNKGSVFSVALAFAHATSIAIKPTLPEESGASDQQASVPHQQKYLSVLYVEDVESNRFLIENLLADYSIRTTTVSSGKAALRFTLLNKFDLILMDIQMPGMDGYQTTREIRKQARGKNKRTPVLAFTAEPYSDELRKKVTLHGIQDVMTKPFDADTLLDKINVCAQTKYVQPTLFTFSFYENVFDQDAAKLKKIKTAVIKDIGRFQTKITLYEIKKNWKGTCKEIHRIRPILKTLGCDTLIKLLDEYDAYDGHGPATKKLTRSVLSHVTRLLKQISKLSY